MSPTLKRRRGATQATVIRTATVEDLSAVVNLHMSAFPGYFLTALGSAFLRSYYKAVLDYPQGILLVAERGAGPVGFVAGSCWPAGFYQLLRMRRFSLAMGVGFQIIRRPRLLIDLGQRYRTTHQRAEAPQYAASSELASLACDPAMRGTGLGRSLIVEFLARSKALGADHCDLTTNRDENEGVRGLYGGLGFVELGVDTEEQGRPVVLYRYYFDNAAEQGALPDLENAHA